MGHKEQGGTWVLALLLRGPLTSQLRLSLWHDVPQVLLGRKRSRVRGQPCVRPRAAFPSFPSDHEGQLAPSL